MNIGENLKKLMTEHGINTLELSRRTGVGQPVIYRIITGETDNPKILTLCSLADYFKVTVDALLDKNDSDDHSICNNELNKIALINWENADCWKEEIKQAKRKLIDTTFNSSCIYALEMYDNSMEPLFLKGMVLLIDGEKQPKDKSYVVVKIKNEKKAMLRQVLFDNNAQYLRSLNPDFEHFKIKLFSKGDKYCGVVIQSKNNF